MFSYLFFCEISIVEKGHFESYCLSFEFLVGFSAFVVEEPIA